MFPEMEQGKARLLVDKARPDDIPALCELLTLLFTQEVEFQADSERQTAGLAHIINTPQLGCILTLRQGTNLLGMINLLFTVSTALGGRVALLEDLIIHPQYRRQGLGSHLLEAAIALAKTSGCLRITLLTDRCNETAQRFYQRYGFQASTMLPMRLSLATG